MAAANKDAKIPATPAKAGESGTPKSPAKSGNRGNGKAKYHPDGLELLTYGANNNFSRLREIYDTAFGAWGENGKWNAELKADRILMPAPTAEVTDEEIEELGLDTPELVTSYKVAKMKDLPKRREQILNKDRREQIQFILDHCDPDLQTVLKLSAVYKAETAVGNSKPNPIKVWDFCQDLGVQLVEEEMTPADEAIYDALVEVLQKKMQIRSGESIRTFQQRFEQQKEECYRRKRSVTFSDADLAKRFWQAVGRCGRYAKSVKDIENLVTMKVPGVGIPKTVEEVVKWCEDKDLIATAESILKAQSPSGGVVTEPVLALDKDKPGKGGKASPGDGDPQRGKRAEEPKASEKQPGGSGGPQGKPKTNSEGSKGSKFRTYICACGESHPDIKQHQCEAYKAIIAAGRKALGKGDGKPKNASWVPKSDSVHMALPCSHLEPVPNPWEEDATCLFVAPLVSAESLPVKPSTPSQEEIKVISPELEEQLAANLVARLQSEDQDDPVWVCIDNAAGMDVFHTSAPFIGVQEGASFGVKGFGGAKSKGNRWGILPYIERPIPLVDPGPDEDPVHILSFALCCDEQRRYGGTVEFDSDRETFELKGVLIPADLRIRFRRMGNHYMCDWRPVIKYYRTSHGLDQVLANAELPPDPWEEPRPEVPEAQVPVVKADGRDNHVLPSVPTVELNKLRYTKRQLQEMEKAMTLLSSGNGASPEQFLRAISSGAKMPRDVTSKAIREAAKVYGPARNLLKGKSRRMQASRVQPSDRELFELTATREPLRLFLDIMFIEGFAFLVSVAEGVMKLIMAVHLVGRGQAEVKDAIFKILARYTSRGFVVRDVSCDGEGAVSALRPVLEAAKLKVDITGAGDHVPQVESGAIKPIKNWVRSVLHGLPYHLPSFLLVALVLAVVFSLNIFPSGQSDVTSKAIREAAKVYGCKPAGCSHLTGSCLS